MFMNKLRGTKKDNRIWWIVVVLVLGFGLVGSYAVWTGGGNIPTANPQGTQNTKQDAKAIAEKNIADTKSTVSQIEARLKNAKDPKEVGSLNVALGNYHYDMGQTYVFQLNKMTEGVTEFIAATKAYLEAVKYDAKNADLRVDFATAAMYSSQNDLAQQQFEEAIKIDPKHLNAHYNYGIFLANSLKKYPEALAQLSIAKDIAKSSNNSAFLDRIAQVKTAVETEMKNPVGKSTSQSTYGQNSTNPSTTGQTYGK